MKNNYIIYPFADRMPLEIKSQRKIERYREQREKSQLKYCSVNRFFGDLTES
jgi:hypothetical protein